MLLSHRIIDTNVPLTAAGYNNDASDDCQEECEVFIERVLLGELVAVIDDEYEVLDEYSKRVSLQGRSEDLAGRFLIHLYQNQGNDELVRMTALPKSAVGDFLDYPDNEDSWNTDHPRCRRFDEDDKKWVALAAKFKKESGTNAPIVNAGDRCWKAFELILNFSGISLEFLCPEERKFDPPIIPTPTDARG